MTIRLSDQMSTPGDPTAIPTCQELQQRRQKIVESKKQSHASKVEMYRGTIIKIGLEEFNRKISMDDAIQSQQIDFHFYSIFQAIPEADRGYITDYDCYCVLKPIFKAKGYGCVCLANGMQIAFHSSTNDNRCVIV